MKEALESFEMQGILDSDVVFIDLDGDEFQSSDDGRASDFVQKSAVLGSNSFESSSSGCEVMEGCADELREQWIKAYPKRNSDTDCNAQSSPQGQTSSPCITPNVIVENSSEDEDASLGRRGNPMDTDEFKRGVEEEWAARQLQLKHYFKYFCIPVFLEQTKWWSNHILAGAMCFLSRILFSQVEKVRRSRKRKRAETLRNIDMQNRQKQRVEEVRETQRKDEENLNTKENFRAEVMKELYQLENTCIDMPSLLNGLGIHVGSRYPPTPQEVHTSYKQALLKFHPDRVSRTNIRKQVEAEEKFKLISRMKEKFFSASCG